jgi:hypothetical protein
MTTTFYVEDEASFADTSGSPVRVSMFGATIAGRELERDTTTLLIASAPLGDKKVLTVVSRRLRGTDPAPLLAALALKLLILAALPAILLASGWFAAADLARARELVRRLGPA